MVLQALSGLRLPEQLPQEPTQLCSWSRCGGKMAGGTTGRSCQEPPAAGKAPTAQQAAAFSQGQHQLTKLYFVTEFSPLTSLPFLSHQLRCNSIIILCCSHNSLLNKQIKMAESRQPRKRKKTGQACDGNFHRTLHSLNKTAALDLGALSSYFCHEYI